MALVMENIKEPPLRIVRESMCIVKHGLSIWKGFFFDDQEQAANAVRTENRNTAFESVGNKERLVLINRKDTNDKYIILSLDRYQPPTKNE